VKLCHINRSGHVFETDTLYMCIDKMYGFTSKKLSYRRETARRFVSLNILLSLKVIRNDIMFSAACVSPY